MSYKRGAGLHCTRRSAWGRRTTILYKWIIEETCSSVHFGGRASFDGHIGGEGEEEKEGGEEDEEVS